MSVFIPFGMICSSSSGKSQIVRFTLGDDGDDARTLGLGARQADDMGLLGMRVCRLPLGNGQVIVLPQARAASPRAAVQAAVRQRVVQHGRARAAFLIVAFCNKTNTFLTGFSHFNTLYVFQMF